MTGEEMERAIEFLLNSQASLTAKTDANTDAIAALIATVNRIEAQAEADRAEMRNSIASMVAQAEADRDEMRSGITTMIEFAESMRDMANNLVQAQRGTSQRVDRLETRADDHENRLTKLEGE